MKGGKLTWKKIHAQAVEKVLVNAILNHVLAANKMLSREQGIAILRVTLGLLFLIPGLAKLMNPSGITGMLTGIGFPIPVVFAWIVIIVEIVGGAALLIGKEMKKAIWPLFIILLVALLVVAIPALDTSNPGTIINVLWHLVGLGGLLSINSTGPGKLFGN